MQTACIMWASIMIKLVNKFKRLELCVHLEVESAQEGGCVGKGAEMFSHWSLTLDVCWMSSLLFGPLREIGDRRDRWALAGQVLESSRNTLLHF